MAGSAFLLAILAFLYKHMGKVRKLLGGRQSDARKDGAYKSKRSFENCAHDYYGTIGRGRK